MKDRDVVVVALLLWWLWPKAQPVPPGSIDYNIDWSADTPPEFQELPPPAVDTPGGGTAWNDPALNWWEQPEFLT